MFIGTALYSTKSTTADTMDRLSCELLHYILWYIDQPLDLFRMSCVCSRWRCFIMNDEYFLNQWFSQSLEHSQESFQSSWPYFSKGDKLKLLSNIARSSFPVNLRSNEWCVLPWPVSRYLSYDKNSSSYYYPISLIDYLINACRPELKAMEKEFQNDRIHFCLRQRAYYAPPQLKNDIESRINTLLSHVTTCTFKTTELYYDIANRASLNLKKIAQNNRCNCDIKIETTLNRCTIPRAIETTSTAYSVSKLIIEQSNLFCSSSMVHRQATLANGSLEVLIGDIAAQKVRQLCESLIERAGEIVQQPWEKSGKNSIPFITETTAGKLCCKRILFLQYTSPSSIALRQQTSSETNTSAQDEVSMHSRKITKLHTPLTVEQRKLIHQTNIEHLISFDKAELAEDEKKIAIEVVDDIIRELEARYVRCVANNQYEQYSPSTYNQELERRKNQMEQQIYLDTGILSYRHWLKQASNLKTKQNIAPFTVSGDINDAPFPMLDEVFENPQLCLRPYTKQFSPWTSLFKSNIWPIACSGYSSQWYYYYYGASSLGSSHYFDAMGYRIIRYRSWGMSTEKQIRQRQTMIDSSNMIKRRKEIAQYFIENYKYITEENLKSYLQFAQRMKDNANELTRLCEMDINSTRKQSKQQTQASLTAIFSLYTEPQGQEASTITSKIEIPSKLSRKSTYYSNTHSILYNRSSVFQIIL
ncbi:unnamed protein product [Rotaria sp. Silwood1]|nr:unnamed protein product [Rotaria sp. Silwood1]